MVSVWARTRRGFTITTDLCHCGTAFVQDPEDPVVLCCPSCGSWKIRATGEAALKLLDETGASWVRVVLDRVDEYSVVHPKPIGSSLEGEKSPD